MRTDLRTTRRAHGEGAVGVLAMWPSILSSATCLAAHRLASETTRMLMLATSDRQTRTSLIGASGMFANVVTNRSSLSTCRGGVEINLHPLTLQRDEQLRQRLDLAAASWGRSEMPSTKYTGPFQRLMQHTHPAARLTDDRRPPAALAAALFRLAQALGVIGIKRHRQRQRHLRLPNMRLTPPRLAFITDAQSKPGWAPSLTCPLPVNADRQLRLERQSDGQSVA